MDNTSAGGSGEDDAMLQSTPAEAAVAVPEPASSSTSSAASGAKVKDHTICEECETSQVIWDCDVCEMGLCDMCFDVLHRKGKRALHGKRARNGGGGSDGGSVSTGSAQTTTAVPSSSGSASSGSSPPKG